MGGLLIIPIGLIIGNLITLVDTSLNPKIIAISLITLAYMAIGGLDDWLSLKNNTNKGLTAKSKIILQSLAGIIFIYFVNTKGWMDSHIALPNGLDINCGPIILLIGLFVLLAESNATNLTDGLDGLASGCGALVFMGLAIELMLRKNEIDPAMASFAMSMAGTWLGFLFHNKNPAKIFMGDAGSLAMGAALSSLALLSNSLWTLLIMGGVFLAESVSVILQVSVYKATKNIEGKGKRILRMAPLHHHYELSGQTEETIVTNFWITTGVLVLIGLIIRPTY